MNELIRSKYLQAMGTDAYVSRAQLPGAASTLRLAIARRSVPVDPPELSKLAAAVVPKLAVPGSNSPSPTSATATTSMEQTPTTRFSLVAVSCGGWLWLEELQDGPQLSAQLLLIQSITQALGLQARDESVGITSTRFDWPIHQNRQLDQSEEAARSSVTGFVQRKLDELACRGLVLLGAECEARVAPELLAHPQLVRTISTARMLHQPLLKRQVWLDLQPLLQPA